MEFSLNQASFFPSKSSTAELSKLDDFRAVHWKHIGKHVIFPCCADLHVSTTAIDAGIYPCRRSTYNVVMWLSGRFLLKRSMDTGSRSLLDKGSTELSQFFASNFEGSTFSTICIAIPSNFDLTHVASISLTIPSPFSSHSLLFSFALKRHSSDSTPRTPHSSNFRASGIT